MAAGVVDFGGAGGGEGGVSGVDSTGVSSSASSLVVPDGCSTPTAGGYAAALAIGADSVTTRVRLDVRG
jgi:hypothetical protein